MAISGKVRKIVAEDINFGTEQVVIDKSDGTTVNANQVNASYIPTSDGRNVEQIIKAVGYSISEFDGLADAVAKIGDKNATLVVDKEVELNQDLTVPENITLKFLKEGLIAVNTGYTLTINGAIEAGLWQIFDGDGTVTGNPKIEAIYPEWFGAKGDGISDDIVGIQKAVDLVLNNNGGVVYLCSKKYYISDVIRIVKNGEAKIKISGNEYYGTELLCSKGGILINNELNNFSTYADRIQQVFLKNLNIINVDGSKIGYGVEIRNFGFIRLDKIFVNGWDTGFYVIDGSELDFFDCRSSGNIYGAKFIRTASTKDLANTNIYSSRFHNNDNNTIVIDSVREINFIGCDIINNNAPLEIRSTYLSVDYVGFFACDLENFNDVPAIKVGDIADTNNISSILFIGCLFANPSANKIEVYKTCNIKIISCNGDYSVYPFIKVNDGFPVIENDNQYFPNILIVNSETPLYVIKMPYTFVNYDNWNFRNGIVSPFVSNSSYSYNTLDYVTGIGSIQFTADGSEKYITISCDIGSGVVIDTIYKSGESNNVKVVLDDGSYVYAYELGVEIKIQEFNNGFIRKLIHILPNKLAGKRIKEIRFVTYSATDDFLIDSIRIYTNDFISIKSGKTVLYNNVSPSNGEWKIGDIIFNTNPTVDSNNMILLGWICVASGTPGTWEPMYVSTVS